MANPQPFKDYIVKFRDGERIYSAGDAGTEMYIVQAGSVELFKDVEGHRVSLAIMEKGDFFGEMALIESAPHTMSAEARSSCELIEINSTLFDKMIRGNIEIAVRMLRKLSLRLSDATRRLEELSVAAASSMTAGPAMQETRAAASMQGAAVGASTMDAAEDVSVVRSMARPPASQPSPDGNGQPRFVSEDGQETFWIKESRATIGRFDPVTGLRPEVDLSSLDLNRSVSRHHARLTVEGGLFVVTEEVGALNGTFLNGKQLVTGKSTPIKDGDELSLGMVKLQFRQS